MEDQVWLGVGKVNMRNSKNQCSTSKCSCWWHTQLTHYCSVQELSKLPKLPYWCSTSSAESEKPLITYCCSLAFAALLLLQYFFQWHAFTHYWWHISILTMYDNLRGLVLFSPSPGMHLQFEMQIRYLPFSQSLHWFTTIITTMDGLDNHNNGMIITSSNHCPHVLAFSPGLPYLAQLWKSKDNHHFIALSILLF